MDNNNNNIYIDLIDCNQIFSYNYWINDINDIDTLKIIAIYIYKYKYIYIIIGSLILILAMIGAIILTLEKQKKIKLNV